MKKKTIAMLIMVDGAVLEEKYFEYTNQDDEWISGDDLFDQAQWFFY